MAHARDIETEAIFDLLPHLRPSADLRQTYQYCNFGLNLLAHVIPTLLNGKPFDEYLRERLLSKLGMDDTVPSRDQVLGELSGRYADGWQHELDVPLAYSTWEKVKDQKGTFDHGSRMPAEMFGPKRAYRFLQRTKRLGPGAWHVITTPADMVSVSQPSHPDRAWARESQG
jgi:CubicO group peptidase (beta-lactamase class C family)